jgi:hypothetical protein
MKVITNPVPRLALLAGAFAGTLAHAATPVTPAAEIRIPGTGIFPESLTSGRDGTVYIGSVGKGLVYRARPGADTVEPFIAPGSGGIRQVFGVYADDGHNTLWVCSNQIGGAPGGPPPPPSALHSFNLKTGAPTGRYEFPGGGMCNDIVTSADGTAYATDTPNMQVLRLAKGGKQLEVWAGGGAFGPPGGVLDGITIVGGRVIVNTLVTSKLFAIDVAKDGKAGEVAQLKLTHPITRPDGMRVYGKDALLSTDGTGKVVKVTIFGNVGTLTTVKDGFDGIVGVTPVGKVAYALEGQLGALMRGPNGPPAPPERPYKAVAIPLE